MSDRKKPGPGKGATPEADEVEEVPTGTDKVQEVPPTADEELLSEADDDIITKRPRAAKSPSRTKRTGVAAKPEPDETAEAAEAESERPGFEAAADVVADEPAVPTSEGPAEADDVLLSEADDDIVARRPRAAKSHAETKRTGLSQTGYTIILLVVILIGVAFGSWLANRGRPAATDTTTATAAATVDATADSTAAATADATSTVAPQVRIMQLQDQIAANPNDVNARLELGVLLFQDAQDFSGAGEQWLAVTQIDPTNEDAWYNLGFYYLSITPPDCPSAQNAWNQVMELDPTGDNASQIENHMAGLMPDVCDVTSSDTPTTGG